MKNKSYKICSNAEFGFIAPSNIPCRDPPPLSPDTIVVPNTHTVRLRRSDPDDRGPRDTVREPVLFGKNRNRAYCVYSPFSRRFSPRTTCSPGTRSFWKSKTQWQWKKHVHVNAARPGVRVRLCPDGFREGSERRRYEGRGAIFVGGTFGPGGGGAKRQKHKHNSEERPGGDGVLADGRKTTGPRFAPVIACVVRGIDRGRRHRRRRRRYLPARDRPQPSPHSRPPSYLRHPPKTAAASSSSSSSSGRVRWWRWFYTSARKMQILRPTDKRPLIRSSCKVSEPKRPYRGAIVIPRAIRKPTVFHGKNIIYFRPDALRRSIRLRDVQNAFGFLCYYRHPTDRFRLGLDEM